jgi:hypothetical protein
MAQLQQAVTPEPTDRPETDRLEMDRLETAKPTFPLPVCDLENDESKHGD